MTKGSITVEKAKGSIQIDAGKSRKAVFNKGSADVMPGQFPKYLVKEHFNQDPPDWKEIGEIATYDAVNKDIDVISTNKLTKDRYSKEHNDLTIDDSFYMEVKFKRTQDNNIVDSMIHIGSFNKSSDNHHNFFGFRLYYGEGLEFLGYRWYGFVFYDDGTADNSGLTDVSINLNVEYLMKMWYDSVNRIATFKLYSGSPDFNILVHEDTIALSSTKTFTVNDFGIGNLDMVDEPTKIYYCDYDDAILTIPGSQSITKNLIAARKNIGSIKGGKVSGSISYR